jgi:hypothetical protein
MLQSKQEVALHARVSCNDGRQENENQLIPQIPQPSRVELKKKGIDEAVKGGRASESLNLFAQSTATPLFFYDREFWSFPTKH